MLLPQDESVGDDYYKYVLYPVVTAGGSTGAVIDSRPSTDGTQYITRVLTCTGYLQQGNIIPVTMLQYEPGEKGLIPVQRVIPGCVEAVDDRKAAKKLCLVRLLDDVKYNYYLELCDDATAKSLRPLQEIIAVSWPENDQYRIQTGLITHINSIDDNRFSVRYNILLQPEETTLIILQQDKPLLLGIYPDYDLEDIWRFIESAGLYLQR